MDTPVNAAVQMLDKGLSCIPCDPLTKRPSMQWKPYQSTLMDMRQATSVPWPGVAIIAGAVSGNVEVLDFDFKAKWFEAWTELVEAEAPGLTKKVLTQTTQSGGKHVVYRCPGIELPGNLELAADMIQVDGPGDHDHQGKTLRARQVSEKWYITPCMIETRCNGGYFLAAPTPGYNILNGHSFSALPEITAQERDILIRSAKALNKYVRTTHDPQPRTDTGDRPGDDYNQRADIRPLLERHGWKQDRTQGDYDYWTRPGKDRGISASLINGQVFRVFTSNAPPFEPDQAYSKFSVYAHLDHDGDFEGAARVLRAEGYGGGSVALPESSTPPNKSTAAPQPCIWDSPVDVQSMIHTPPPAMRWFVHGNIPAGRGIIITGLGGSSKTRLLYQLAMGAAVGDLPWQWDIGIQGKSVLVLTEDTQDDVHRTLHALCTSITLDPDQLQKIYNSIIVYPLAGTDVRLLNFGRDRELIKTDLFFSLESKIKSIGNVAFVGLDPALSLTAGDEQDQGHQRALGKMTDDLAVRSGATVALVTHATKASLAQDELTSHASRGGGGITDAVRAEFAMRTMTAAEARKAGIADIEERKRHVQLVGTKGNLLPPAAYVPVWLRRDDYGTLIHADVSLTHQPHDPSSEDLQALDILKDMSLKHTPSLADWRQSCLEGGLFAKSKTTEAQTKAMQRTIKRLNQAGLIQKGIGRGIWLPTETLRTSEMDSLRDKGHP